MKRSLGPRKRNWVSLPLWSSELPSIGPQTHTVLRLLEEFVILQCWGRVCCCVRRRLLLLASLSRAHAVGGLGARESILILWVEFRLGLSPAVVHYVPRVLPVLISNSELLSLKVDIGFIRVWTCSARLGSRAVGRWICEWGTGWQKDRRTEGEEAWPLLSSPGHAAFTCSLFTLFDFALCTWNILVLPPPVCQGRQGGDTVYGLRREKHAS